MYKKVDIISRVVFVFYMRVEAQSLFLEDIPFVAADKTAIFQILISSILGVSQFRESVDNNTEDDIH